MTKKERRCRHAWRYLSTFRRCCCLCGQEQVWGADGGERYAVEPDEEGTR